MNRYIFDLDSETAANEAHAGGKGAPLARLRKHGLRVPSGFVIARAAFQELLLTCDIEGAAQQREWTPDGAQYAQDLLMGSQIPEHLAQQIERAYRRLGGRVAVRSSMVGEDSNTALNVEEEDHVLNPVKRCWASTFGWRLISYRGRRNAHLQRLLPGTAVVVQRMVDAKAAGVALGADPVTGQNGQGNAGRPQRRWGTGSPLSFAPPFPGAYVQWAGGRRLFDHAGQISR